MLTYKVLMFAGLADACGSNSLEVHLGPASSVAALVIAAKELCPALAKQTFRVAVNSCYVEESAQLPDHAEVAFIPPVSGG
ncbi:MAG: MoaD/ThiS family protein [Planctomycetota bacterium]|jgi:molybdopterin converting factor small subunit|nr:MoaD/ThiS family protein [Planctomycetota bacterium]